MDLSELRINIVYIPGTVSYLSCFPLTLIEWSEECRFRLVSNGCSADEENTLSQLADSDGRLEFLSLQSNQVLSHGEALTILQRQETDRYFAFLDSDIFATGEFLSDFIKGLASADAVFCSPSTWGYGEETEMPSWQMWDSGAYSTLAGGTCIGTTHCAAYSNEMLAELMAESGIDLRSYYWREIPKAIQKELTQRKQVKAIFDTGKLANILLGNRGRSLELATAPTLSHLGGISVSVHRMGASLPSALVRLLGGTLGRYIYFRAKSGQFVSLREVKLVRHRARERRASSEILMRSLKAHFNGTMTQEEHQTESTGAFHELDAQLEQVYQKYHGRLESVGAPLHQRVR